MRCIALTRAPTASCDPSDPVFPGLLVLSPAADRWKGHPASRLRRLPLAIAAARAPDESQNVQVPVCPLCNNPVPVRKGEIPDMVVGEHIDRDCNYHRKTEKIFTYRCSKEGCKKKEMLRVACDQCRGSFCIRHRHPLDHSCKHGGRPIGAAGCTAARASESKPSGASNTLSSSWLAQRLRWRVKR
ncbi:AN1-type zinc finger protein 2A isoform X1 [Ursus maritimus]|uniref:AN1-type zinc finger protein 2A isoform X1 n=1 Tax=Ursus maritimus TaxID=29073 RepID=A0A8M1G702_URSMA|nr:AN1-type zinc finger protein 2A isoform X1 [Ursus maritimus]